MAHTKTATKIAKPSIQALGLYAAEAVLVSKTIERIAATNRILKVKSYNASQNSSKSPGGSWIYF